MKKFQFPSAQTVLLIIAAIVALLTWIVPAGEYDRLTYVESNDQFFQTGEINTSYPATQSTLDSLGIKIPLEKFTSGSIWKPISIPGTYSELEARPQGVVEYIQSPLKGIHEAIDVILFVLILGGCIGIVNHSGAFDGGVSWLAKKLKGREILLIVIITALIAVGGTTFGLAEETIAFYPILVPVFLAARYDAMVALATIFIGSSIGTMGSTVNPFSAIIASDAAGITWTTGIYGRFAMLIGGTAICIWYIIRYAERVRKDPKKSLIYDQQKEIEGMFLRGGDKEEVAFTNRIRLTLIIFLLCFIVMILGVSQWDWWFTKMTSVFFVGAILIGFIIRIKEKDFVNTFVKGAGDLLGVALIIGFARGITVLMEEGLISDTMLHYASSSVEGMSAGVFIVIMMILYMGLSFFIPSSSGMAVLTMPIMAPLADVVGVGRESVVDAYIYGLGLFAFISPTSLILASLAMVNVGFNKWIKFIMPLIGILFVFAALLLVITVYLG